MSTSNKQINRLQTKAKTALFPLCFLTFHPPLAGTCVLTPHADGVFNDPHWDYEDCVWVDKGLGMPETGIEDYAPYRKDDILWVTDCASV